jgi:hypothetical protein
VTRESQPMPGMTLDESARRLGHLGWLEERCFETLGGWVKTTRDPGAKLAFARHSYHHAWHAELLARCLPETRDHDPALLVAPWSDEWVGFVESLRALGTTEARVVGAYEVLLPTLIGTYEGYLAAASPIRDAAAIRWVGVVLGDERADAAQVSALLERAARAPGAADGRVLEGRIPLV